ncbi:MAG: 50S ribosomal protein L9 [Betaproteobacteria bacterium TMED41]|nr:MAG: 50S ribosomal protein L9 [Betaproteobacteria bacterium TMED41]|tara:strand:+ start:349 stop:810 length:462 start_codon:yes stop_codon:yes gene_type:complete
MQVILLDKISKLGNLGEVIRVRDGYARNFLIPQGLAKRATQAAVAEFESRRNELEKLAEKKLLEAKKIESGLKGKSIDIIQKAGVDGRLFGSVTSQDIVDNILKEGITISRSQISFKDGPIKSLGQHLARIAIHSEITVELVVNVISENQENS